MKVLETRESFLTNFEVLQVLEQRRSRKPKKGDESISSLETICVEVLAYLRERPAGNLLQPQTATQIEHFLRAIRDRGYSLEKAELVQIINSAPTSMPVLYTLVEECEIRFSAEQLEDLLNICITCLGREPVTYAKAS